MFFLKFHRDHHDDQGGLHRDLLQTGAAMDRRGMLRTAARLGVALGAIPLIGCTSDGSSLTGTGNGTDGTGIAGNGSSNSVAKIPEETAGPYPGDGSNGPNALRTTGVVPSDIRSSFGGLSEKRDGRAAQPRVGDGHR